MHKNADFTARFGKFAELKDKYEAEFMIICHNITYEKIKEKLKHQLELMKSIKYDAKRHHLLTKMNDLTSYIERIQEPDVKRVNSVFMVHEKTEEVPLIQKELTLLLDFNVDTYIFKYGHTFDLEYLHNLLHDESYYNVLHLNNTCLTHIHLNKTKRKIFNKKDKKDINIQEYILNSENNISNKELCIIHGVSGAITKYSTKNSNILVFNKFLHDSEIFDSITKHISVKNSSELQEWIGNMTNPKLSHRLLFGKDIQKAMGNRMLKTLYCTEEFSKKVQDKVPQDMLIFDTVIVASYENNDTGDKLKKDYSGAIGITYY